MRGYYSTNYDRTLYCSSQRHGSLAHRTHPDRTTDVEYRDRNIFTLICNACILMYRFVRNSRTFSTGLWTSQLRKCIQIVKKLCHVDNTTALRQKTLTSKAD